MKFKEIIHLLIAFWRYQYFNRGYQHFSGTYQFFFLSALSIQITAFLEFFCALEYLILKVDKRLRDIQKTPFKDITPLFIFEICLKLLVCY